jgi:hypothetical protein
MLHVCRRNLRAQDQRDQHSRDRDDLRPFNGDLEGDNGLRIAQQESAYDAARDRAEAADDYDCEGFDQGQQAHSGDYSLKRRDQHACRCGDSGRKSHHNRIHPVRWNAHVLRRFGVLRDRQNRCTEFSVLHEQPQPAEHHDASGERHQPLAADVYPEKVIGRAHKRRHIASLRAEDEQQHLLDHERDRKGDQEYGKHGTAAQRPHKLALDQDAEEGDK